MARFRKPFCRPSRGLGYVWHEGRQPQLLSELREEIANVNAWIAQNANSRLGVCA
jgi:hypothetical protein